jgi:DNA ligase-1
MNYTKNEHGHYVWPTLYKTASKGKEQKWDICVVPLHGERGDIVVEHGQVGGKIQVAIVTVEKGKNLGKKNATTGEEQAGLEAQAKWLKQQDKGYSVERGGGSMELKPMLAHAYGDVKDKVVFPAYVQPKLDGCRCLAYKEAEGKVRLISRQNKEFGAWLDHIREAVDKIASVGDILDGELYVHGVPFQKVVSWIKKEQPATSNLQYHIYDRVSDECFADRSFANALLLDPVGSEAAKPHVFPDSCLVQVPTLSVESHEDVEKLHEKFVSEGYEGAILRVGDCKYTQGYRSRQLLKVKAFHDAEFEIVGVIDGKGKFAGRAIFQCKTLDGYMFEAVPRGRDELRQRYFDDREKLIGKQLTVKFFDWTSSEESVPRFPIALSVRDYE